MNAQSPTKPPEALHSSSLERIIPDELQCSQVTGDETLKLHITRYEFARQHLIPGRVLDLACGVGYGTSLLQESSIVTEAIGVDICKEAIEYANQRYSCARARFICSPALAYRPAMAFENIVSLETIEHVIDANELLVHLISLLKPGGRLIASVPITPSVDANPHHKANFTAASFAQLGERLNLRELCQFRQLQPYSPAAVLLRREKRTSNLRSNIVKFYLHHPAQFLRRVGSLLRDGFTNKYLTIVWEKNS